jgi:hypothetical protein
MFLTRNPSKSSRTGTCTVEPTSGKRNDPTYQYFFQKKFELFYFLKLHWMANWESPRQLFSFRTRPLKRHHFCFPKNSFRHQFAKSHHFSRVPIGPSCFLSTCQQDLARCSSLVPLSPRCRSPSSMVCYGISMLISLL